MPAPPGTCQPGDAEAPTASIVDLLRTLVRSPSRAVQDDLLPVLARMEDWFSSQGLGCRRILSPDGRAVALYAEVQGTGVAACPRTPYWMLNATLDTAGFGDLAAWSHDPLGADIVDGWLVGRGAADSKAGAALFAHLLKVFAAQPGRFAGRLGVLFDLDEHSGAFGGAHAFFDGPQGPRPDGVIIGYPGMHSIVAGGRGFARARIAVRGVAAHSGGTGERGRNAITRAADLVQALQALPLPALTVPGFELPPQLTVTAIQAGDGGFSVVPDRCELGLDIRLTPAFDESAAKALIGGLLDAHDGRYPAELASSCHWLPGWPAYRVPADHAMVLALQQAARDQCGLDLPCEVVGPSNIGNYLASLGVPALCGFGVQGRHVHAADEAVELASIAPVLRIYWQALQQLLRS